MNVIESFVVQILARPWLKFILSKALYPLGLIYRGLVYSRNCFYDGKLLPIYKLDGLCISIGNLTVGGTGKTPLTIEVANYLKNQGHRPVILSRGYKSGLSKGRVALYQSGELVATDDPKGFKGIYADEARMQSAILKSVPVLISGNRYKASCWFIGRHPSYAPTHWILDDGFQHRKIHRDCDVLLISSHNALAKEKVIPQGFLREQLTSMRRAQVIIHTRPEGKSYENNKNLCRNLVGKDVRVLSSSFQVEVPVQVDDPSQKLSFEMGPAVVVCAIANPQQFFQNIENLKIPIAHKINFLDHSPINLKKVLPYCRPHQPIITTEKDYWRDPSVFRDLKNPVFISKISVSLDMSFLNDYL